MRMRKAVQIDADIGPETRSELHLWVRERLRLSAPEEQALLHAIDGVSLQHERLWQQSKQEAIQAVSAGFAERLNRMREELTARDATSAASRGTSTVGERRPYARQLAHDLLGRADKLMYQAKAQGSSQTSPLRVRVVNGALEEIAPNEHPE